MRRPIFVTFAAILLAGQTSAKDIAAVEVTRLAPDRVAVRWTDEDPVDVFVADRAEAAVGEARLASREDRDGTAEVDTAGIARPYILLRDGRSGAVVRAAERVVPLEHGSNFRDVGGYPAAGGKHVRWGRIYRSGATPMLSDADVRELKALGLANLIDLRSSEERVIAPTRIDGVAYSAVGYSMAAILGDGGPIDMNALYRAFPAMLAPQVRMIFRTLLANEGPVAFNCSAGQDRTGFATAVVLGALGVPRDVILADYLLSTANRRPEYEMPPIDTTAQANNPVAMYFARGQKSPAAHKPKPLYGTDGVPYLTSALDEVDRHWGSIENYLQKEAGIGPLDIARLRASYLE